MSGNCSASEIPLESYHASTAPLVTSEMMASSSYAYFGIYGEFDPGALASSIGLEPAVCEARHSRDAGRKLRRTSLLRFAHTHAEDSDRALDIYELAESVYTKLKDHTKQIADAVRLHGASATFQVVLYFPVSDDVSTPAIGFSEQVVRFVSEVGASIDIDTYRA